MSVDKPLIYASSVGTNAASASLIVGFKTIVLDNVYEGTEHIDESFTSVSLTCVCVKYMYDSCPLTMEVLRIQSFKSDNSLRVRNCEVVGGGAEYNWKLLHPTRRCVRGLIIHAICRLNCSRKIKNNRQKAFIVCIPL